ncbi:putative glutathione transferase [Rosa chinensis]|uniref:Putative glutathione transferase n=1 Tax=Rosa chinensis TaxID=74649 RepID=A0A2P6QQV8_ROSCH|nr:putative glutathione transferase [Rosa chinensis]
MPNPRQECWKDAEDIALCIAVVTVGEDGSKGTSQEKKKLWERIHEVYETCKPAGGVVRLGGGCDGRWKKIRPACARWRQALNKAALLRGSGDNATDEILQAKSIYRTLAKGEEFAFEHCWPILKDTKKFSNPPGMNVGSSSFPTSINLEDDGIPASESPSSSNVHARPPGQKAQKAAKKKSRQDETGELLLQMQRIADQGERDLEYRLRLREETKLAEQHADDARTMKVDPSIFTPKKGVIGRGSKHRLLRGRNKALVLVHFVNPPFLQKKIHHIVKMTLTWTSTCQFKRLNGWGEIRNILLVVLFHLCFSIMK